MDVTFFEQQPFYPKHDIQGENSVIHEYQLWDITTIEQTSFPSLSSSDSFLQDPIPNLHPTQNTHLTKQNSLPALDTGQ